MDDQEFGAAVLEQMFTLWIDPELIARAGEVDRAAVSSAVVELLPEGGSRVRLNSEVALQARAVANAPIPKGALVTTENVSSIESFWPTDIGVDSGWMALYTLAGQPLVAFDFRYNKSRTTALLLTAQDFLEAARRCRGDLLNPTVDLLYSAAELTVHAQVVASAEPQKRGMEHRIRGEWLAREVKLNNVPPVFDATLQLLRRERSFARYGEGSPGLVHDELDQVAATVDQMLTRSVMRTGARLERQSEKWVEVAAPVR